MPEYPASLTVHWPTGPVDCSDGHAEKLVAVAKTLGYHVGIGAASSDAECTNCKNEAVKKAAS